MPVLDDPDYLDAGLTDIGNLISGIHPEQWGQPTPCDMWDVRTVASHITGMNLVFATLLAGKPTPERMTIDDADQAAAYTTSAVQLSRSFREPGVLEREFGGPLGARTGRDRLWIRMYDLLAHGWDLGRATGQHIGVPDSIAERALRFAEHQVDTMPRDGRFNPPQPVTQQAPPIDSLAAFLGRDVSWLPKSLHGTDR